MKWQIPPKIKIYEALGSIADERIEINEAKAKVYSSSKNKFYEIEYDEKNNSIMGNDNASYFVGYLGYPSIAYLMKIGELEFNEKYAEALKEIAWKDINQKNKNDFEKTTKEINEILIEKNINLDEFEKYLETVMNQIKSKQFNLLGKKRFPPKGY